MPPSRRHRKSPSERNTERIRRSKERRREKDEFARIEYLKSQLDDKGNPLDILHTDVALLSNEQKFVVTIMKQLSKFDPLSITTLIDEHYDDELIDEIVDYYYSNKENKTWSDRLFNATYNCLRITNLTYLLKDDVLNNMDELFRQLGDSESESEKDVLTDAKMIDIIEKCRIEIPGEIDMSKIINSLLLVFVQNVQMCHDYEITGDRSKKLHRGGGMSMLLLIFLIIIFLWYVLHTKGFFTSAKLVDVKPTEQTPMYPKRLATAEDKAKLELKLERDRLKRAERYARQLELADS